MAAKMRGVFRKTDAGLHTSTVLDTVYMELQINKRKVVE